MQIRLQSAGASQASANAIQVTTSAVAFDRDTGEARTDKPVTFRWPAGEGRAEGVSYDSNSGTLRLLQGVALNLSTSSAALPEKPDETNEKIVRVSGESMSFQRVARIVRVDGDVHAQQVTHELTAQEMLLELDANFQARRFVASGHPQLHDLSPQGPLLLSADEIVSQLRADGSMESIVATGNVHGTRNTPVGGDGIDAGRVQVDLATRDNVPRLLTASNGVTLTSTSASFNGGTRHVESDALEIHFSSSSRPGQALMESVNTLAPARVEWQSVALVKGNPVPQLTRMAGQRMSLKFDGQNTLQELASTGGVEVTRKLGDAPDQTTVSRELIAKFDKAGEWTNIDQTGDVRFHDAQRAGQGDRARLDRATNTVTLDGSVIFSDATTRTTAQSVSFAPGTNILARRRPRVDHGYAPQLGGQHFQSRAGARAHFGGTPRHGHSARACGLLRQGKIVAGAVGDRGEHDRIGQPDAYFVGKRAGSRGISSGGVESEAGRGAGAIFEPNSKAADEKSARPGGASHHAIGACSRWIADVLGDGVARPDRAGRAR